MNSASYHTSGQTSCNAYCETQGFECNGSGGCRCGVHDVSVHGFEGGATSVRDSRFIDDGVCTACGSVHCTAASYQAECANRCIHDV